MVDTRLLQSIRIRNLLSFGPECEAVELGPLNVLIGPNASGKSNFIEAIGLLRAASQDLAASLRQGGGISEWLWKGGGVAPVAQIEAVVAHPPGPMPLHYRLEFSVAGQRLNLVGETVENVSPASPEDFFYRFAAGRAEIYRARGAGAQPGVLAGRHPLGFVTPEIPIVAQMWAPDDYPEITYIGDVFRRFGLYTGWEIGKTNAARAPVGADAYQDRLSEDAANLPLVVNDLLANIPEPKAILTWLRRVDDRAEEILTRIVGGTVLVWLRERGLTEPISASRLSDGTLRFLALLAILSDPTPAPLICIEEPEIGLHPDALAAVADLLVEASQRTQLIVTTHSDALVSALSTTPESVLVCNRDERGTRLERLEPKKLRKWLDKYSLGELWRMGEIGGNP